MKAKLKIIRWLKGGACLRGLCAGANYYVRNECREGDYISDWNDN